jgi:cellulose synthase/poly-beta-1,6-N-acetylglucosamine synthase-like glycosyltransferase
VDTLNAYSVLQLVITGLTLLALAFTLFNALTIWRPQLPPERWSKDVSLLIPLRNEARNVSPLIESLKDSLSVERERQSWEVIALNDQSSDQTGELIQNAKKSLSELNVLNGETPPSGWLGKPAAQERLFKTSRGRYLVFIDADVRLAPGAISAAIDEMESMRWDWISPYPRQIAKSFLERIIQPLLQWSWFASVPLTFAAKFRIPSMAVANGQFFIVRRDALSAIGGFDSVKGEVLEDIELARRLWRAGLSGSVVDGSAIAHCKMYESNQELIDGYSKSLWRAFGSPAGALFAIALMVATSWLPLIAGILGNPWGWFAFFAISLSRLVAALRTASFWQSFLLHPLSVALLTYMVARSFRLKRTGNLTWRDRAIAT